MEKTIINVHSTPDKKVIVAPKAQLLVTENNVSEVLQRIFVKKSAIINPDIINSIKHLVRVNTNKDPKRQLALFYMRQQVLDYAGEIYIMNDETQLFDESALEAEVIMKLVEECTIVRK
jgi:hypothetical protein